MYILISFNSKDAWQVYPNKSGVHSNIRHHLQKNHKNQYNRTIHNENLKGNMQKAIKNHNAIRLPLTQDSLRDHLVEWITATDQVCHCLYLCVVPELRFLSLSHFEPLNTQVFESCSSMSQTVSLMMTYLLVPHLQKQRKRQQIKFCADIVWKCRSVQSHSLK